MLRSRPDISGEGSLPTCSFLPWPVCSPSASISTFLGWIHPPFQSPFSSSCHHIIITCDFACPYSLPPVTCQFRSGLSVLPCHLCLLLILTCHYPGAGSSALALIFHGSFASCLHVSRRPWLSYTPLQVISQRPNFAAPFLQFKTPLLFLYCPELSLMMFK